MRVGAALTVGLPDRNRERQDALWHRGGEPFTERTRQELDRGVDQWEEHDLRRGEDVAPGAAENLNLRVAGLDCELRRALGQEHALVPLGASRSHEALQVREFDEQPGVVESFALDLDFDLIVVSVEGFGLTILEQREVRG